MPEAVRVEVVDNGKKLKKMDALLVEQKISDGKIIVKKISKYKDKTRLLNDFNLHDGEAESIILYNENKADLLGTDDYRTIKTCRLLSIKYFSTPAFVYQCFVACYLEKDIALLKMDKLSKIGWYTDEVLDHFKKQIQNLGDDVNGERDINSGQ
ncbi:MAG TPA: hypothetical protein VKM55_28780 [Candidatus Lokiarchaeia archaeon]|nr:hypothetical protein [Candidatus Lokiarchaeia archaeon]